MFIAAGVLAFINITCPARRPGRIQRHATRGRPDPTNTKIQTSDTDTGNDVALAEFPSGEPTSAPALSPYTTLFPRYAKLPMRRSTRKNVGRSRLTFALLTLFTFLAAMVASSVIQSLVVGYVLAGVYAAAKYNMST